MPFTGLDSLSAYIVVSDSLKASIDERLEEFKQEVEKSTDELLKQAEEIKDSNDSNAKSGKG